MLYGSDLYFLDSVHEECVNFLMDSIDDDNCFIIKDIAQFRRLPSLSIESSKYALRNFMLVAVYNFIYYKRFDLNAHCYFLQDSISLPIISGRKSSIRIKIS